MSKRINARCQKCKRIMEKGSYSGDDREKAYFCNRCNEKTGEVTEMEEVNRVSKNGE